MPTANNINMTDAAATESSSPPAPPPPELPPTQPPTGNDGEVLHLIKPDNVKSRFWTHFMKYDPEYHPDKKTTARCSLCGKDISVKQGTGGLKNHMKFKHPKENAILLELGDVPTGMKLFDAATVGTGTMSGGSKTSITIPARKKTKYELEAEKQTKEKHLMEMWSMTRKEISELRKDLKNEEDADAIADMEQDLRQLRKRKAGYAKELGMNEEESSKADV